MSLLEPLRAEFTRAATPDHSCRAGLMNQHAACMKQREARNDAVLSGALFLASALFASGGSDAHIPAGGASSDGWSDPFHR